MIRHPVVKVKISAMMDAGARKSVIDISDMVLLVTTDKAIASPFGGFSITLPDKPFDGHSLQDLIWPMDHVEISLGYAGDPDYPVRVVMRGLVRTITGSATIQDGSPQRIVTISGADYGLMPQLTEIWYNVNYPLASDVYSRFKLASNFGLGAEPMPVSDFIRQCLGVINSSKFGLQSITRNTIADGVENTEGSVGVTALNTWVGPLWGMMTQFADQPWNEIFIRDEPDQPKLIFRPCPLWLLDDPGSAAMQGGTQLPIEREIRARDIEMINLSRDEAQVFNFFEVHPVASDFFNPATLYQAMRGSPNSDYYIGGSGSSSAELFGLRRLKMTTYLSDLQGIATGQNAATTEKNNETLIAWTKKRITQLRDLHKDAIWFERGTISTVGRPDIMIGQRVSYDDGTRADAYIIAVQHQWKMGAGYGTRLAIERGTGHRNRYGQSSPTAHSRQYRGSGV